MYMSVTAYNILHVHAGEPTSQQSRTYRIIVEKGEDGWFVATCPELPGLVTQGKTEDEIEKNAYEAVSLMIEGTPDENKEFNLYVVYRDSE
jgi:predicted RNase H-like HicB family nuclease